MPIIRRMAGALAVGSLCLLATPCPVSMQQNEVSTSTAHAQSGAPPARIEFYLPPARISPPVPVPRPRRRRPVRPVVEGPKWKWPTVGTAPAPARSKRRARPGLYTVSRVGRRLLYRKGYLGDIPVHVVVADLNDPEIKIGIVVARGGIGSRESFDGMIRRARPAAAMTGTFFGLSNSLPTGDLVVNGRAVYQGFIGTAVAFTEGNVVSFIPTGYKEKTTWRLFDGVMRGGPLLVQEGRIAVAPREEGFVSLSAAARRARTAVGLTAGRKLVLMAVKQPVSLWRLAKLMRGQGAYHAVAMDGGTSTGLYFGGEMIARPGRALTNALAIYAHHDRYRAAKNSFLPGYRPRPPVRPAPEPPLRIEVEQAPDMSPPPTLPDESTSTLIPQEAPPSTAPPVPAPSGAEAAAPAPADAPAAAPIDQGITAPPASR